MEKFAIESAHYPLLNVVKPQLIFIPFQTTSGYSNKPYFAFQGKKAFQNQHLQTQGRRNYNEGFLMALGGKHDLHRVGEYHKKMMLLQVN